METPPPSDRQPGRRLRPRADTLICLGVAGLCAWLYFWSARQPDIVLFTREPAGYYGLLTAGFRHGHLHIESAPDPRLLALPDPYDPVANAPFRLHDMTLYHGEYYMYFGVTPVLILFWPVAALTGWYPTEACAVALFGFLGVAAGLAVLGALRRRYFLGAPPWSLAVAGLCLALANPILTLTAGVRFYQVPIACAFCLSAALAGALYLALHSPRRTGTWLAAASLLFGLVVGARPNYVLGGLALVVTFAWLLRQRLGARGGRAMRSWSPEQRRAGRHLALATFGPALLCGTGLALYNWLRFGSVLEFGWHYQLAGQSYIGAHAFGLRNIVPNARTFLAGAGVWQRYFPFFVPTPGKPYGMLRYIPWSWLAAFAFLPLAGESRDLAGRRLTFARALGALWLANLLLLSCFFWAEDRYLNDFVPEGLLLGGVGVLTLSAWVARRRGGRALAGLAILGAAAMSIFIEQAAFAARSPAAAAMLKVGRIANGPTNRWERARGLALGPLRLEVELPLGKAGVTEPLVQTGGAPDAWDRVQVRYLADGRAQFSLFHAGLGELAGTPVSLPLNRRATIELRLGSLLPPFSHPVFAPWTEDQYETAYRDTRITVNGADVLRAALACYPSPPQEVRLGSELVLGDWPGGRFSGTILASRRLPLEPPPPASPLSHARLPVDLTVMFPADRTSGTEPLLATGTGVRSDLLGCAYDGSGHLRFTFDHFGYEKIQGELVAFDPLAAHHLVLWLGSLAGEDERRAPDANVPWSRRVVVLMDGAVAFNEDSPFYPAAPETVRIGLNRFGSTVTTGHFTGLVLAEGQAPDLVGLPPLRRSGETGLVELQVLFPAHAAGVSEPLVVTGTTGAGDLVYVRYLDASHLRFGFDHWGVGGFTGGPVAIDYGRPHRLEITMDSLLAPGPPLPGRVRVLLDGATVLEGSSPCYPSRAYDIRIGRNSIGGSTTGPAFTGRILGLARKH